jgi:hypothetical protein
MFDAVCVGLALNANLVDGGTTALAMLGTWAAVSGTAVGAASIVDVAAAAPSLGLSFLWVGALSTSRGFAMADLPPEWPENPVPWLAVTMGAVGTAAGVGGVLVGHALQLSRSSVWLVDVGAGVGARSTLALATGLRAGTPAAGWESVLGGTPVGAGGGLLAAHALRRSAPSPPPGAGSPAFLPVTGRGGVDVVPAALVRIALP